MEDTQSFRLLGNLDTEEIPCEHIDGQSVICWEDIEQVFPGVKQIKNGKVTINMMRDSNLIRIKPHRIKHYPGIILDIILSTIVEHVLVNKPMASSSLTPIIGKTDTLTPHAWVTLPLELDSVEDNWDHAWPEVLQINPTLHTLIASMNLSLKDMYIGTIRTQGLYKKLSTFTILNLEYVSIEDSGAQLLSKALKTNKSVTTLNLGFSAIGSKGAHALSQALKTNLTLDTLDLGGNSIKDKGVRALSEALQINKTLTMLNLISTSIGDSGAWALSQALGTDSILTTLKLEYNSIGDVGARAIFGALKTNRTLTTLHLSDNAIRDDGALAISETLITNSTLIILRLDFNVIGDIGAQALSRALKINLTLNTLTLWSNSIKNKELQQVPKTSTGCVRMKL